MKNRKYLMTAGILYFLQLTSLKSQNFILYGDKTYGGNETESGGRFIRSGTNQFVLFGSSSTNIDGDKTDSACNYTGFGETDNWLIKIDTAFNITWDRSVGGGRSDQHPNLIFTGINGQMIFSSQSQSDSSCEKSENNRSYPNFATDYWVCLIDSNGNEIWDKTFGGINADEFTRIIQLSSGDYIVAGVSSSPVSGDKTVANYGGRDYWTIKLDTSGNILWNKVYGGTGQENSGSGYYNRFWLMAEAGGNFIIAGTTNSPVSGNISDTSRGGLDIWIIKCDSAGNAIWDKRYGGSGNEICHHVIKTSDNGYILCGGTSSPISGEVSDSSRGGYDVWIVKIDSLGNIQWNRRYGSNNIDEGVWIESAPGGGYWVSGRTDSDSSFEVSEPNYGAGDYWIFKTDNVGNMIWDKRFGGPGLDIASNFIIRPDTSIFLFGYAETGTSPVKTDSGKGGYDYWLVHFKYSDITTGINEAVNKNNLISVYPNPSSGLFILQTNSTLNKLVVTNVLGETIYKQEIVSLETEINLTNQPNGIYFAQLKSSEGIIARKIILSK